jgi:microcompartment protein CcmL/EutN
MVALVEATDAALKAANVSYRGFRRVGSGLVTVILDGDVAAVSAAVEAGSQAASRVGEVVSTNIIPRPHADISKIIPK